MWFDPKYTSTNEKQRRISTIVKGDYNPRVLKTQSLNYTQKDTFSILVKISFYIYIYIHIFLIT